MLPKLARLGLIIDKVHATVENSGLFSPEFKDGIDSINKLLTISEANNPELTVPVLVMSATFRIHDQLAFNKMIGRIPDLVEWGPMDNRTTGYSPVSMVTQCMPF